MKTLENNTVLNELLNDANNPEIKSGLTETLGDKSYNLKTFYSYLSEKINSVRNDENFGETPFGKDYHKIHHDVVFRGVDTISEAEVRRIIKELNEYLATKREILKEPFVQKIPDFRAGYQDKEYYLKKINDRSLPISEYEKMQDQIEKYGSILSRSNRRGREFGGGEGDVILSLTNGKIYDVEGKGENALKEDYKSSRYYTSGSGASAAGNIYAGKGSLIYMPTTRMDVTYPSLYLRDINGLNMSMSTSRGVVDEKLPTIIKSGKVDLGVDVVLLSQKNHLEQGTARDLINTIETKGENLGDRPVYTYKVKYLDENLEEKEKTFTYKTNMNPKDINFRLIGKVCFGINRGFEVEDTGSFIDKAVGIKKYQGKYVRLGQFGLIKEVFDEHPRSNIDGLYYDDIEIGDKNMIIHKKVEIEPMFAEYNTHRKFNGWILGDHFAYKNIKDLHYFSGYELRDICSEHNIEFSENLDKDDTYHLIYEDNIGEYNELLKKLGIGNMEFEYYVPRTIFEKFSIDYRKEFLSEKLKDKAMKNIDVYSLPGTTQKNIARNYIRTHQNTVFTLQDSYDSGNCHPGTARFVETFNLPERILGKDLLKHKDFEKMLGIYDFRKIFVRKALS